MDYSELLRHVDHTLLTPTATWDQVKTVCDEGLTCRTASVCIPPRYVKRAAAYVGNVVFPPLFGLLAQYISISLYPWYLLAALVLMAVMSRALHRKTAAKRASNGY